jgi:pantothenate kinase-related protein Tda10
MIQDIINHILQEIEERQQENETILIAIDGRCGSGKTTLSKEL